MIMKYNSLSRVFIVYIIFFMYKHIYIYKFWTNMSLLKQWVEKWYFFFKFGDIKYLNTYLCLDQIFNLMFTISRLN